MSRTRVVHVNDNVPGAVYIGRANGRKGLKASKWANPYVIGRDGTRAEVIEKYRQHITPYGEDGWLNVGRHIAIMNLAGKPLACWCRHDGEARSEANACHGDVLVEMIEEMGLEAQP